ncbi:MAG: type III PLP-dependent enzyme, partial [Nitrosospira sp.]|nr:type III PLP-dependent enzyme [Nitrosospira sp.]
MPVEKVLKKEIEINVVPHIHDEVNLDFRHVQTALNRGYSKPFLLVDSSIIRNKIRRFRAAMPRVNPHYAVKANQDLHVLKTLIEEGAG